MHDASNCRRAQFHPTTLPSFSRFVYTHLIDINTIQVRILIDPLVSA